jgi:hypothetical protein
MAPELPVLKALAKSPNPPSEMALLLGPKAIATSPIPDSAVALPPPLKTSIPSMEMSKSLVAEAIPGVAATAAPIPRPTASMPSRPIPRAFFIGLPFLTAPLVSRATGCGNKGNFPHICVA